MSVTQPVVAIELYDAGIRIGDGSNILVDSISCALIESQTILVGEQAEHQAHLRPREISTNYWANLSENSETKHVVSNANIALQHLKHACKEANCSTETIILITPTTLDKQDLGLLLGICKKLSLNVVGLVSNAALVMQQHIPNCKAVFLDLLQQKLAISELIQSDAGISLKQPNRIINYGLQSFIGNCAQSIADKFISETRFDPLHSANDEQLFFDMLPLWLNMLKKNNSIECKLKSADKNYSINIDQNHLQQSNQKLFEEIAAHLSVLFHNNKSVVIFCSSSCGQAFGLQTFLNNLPGCAIVALSNDSIINHALNNKNELINNGQVHYINSLPWQNSITPLSLQFNAGQLANITSKPTHVLIDGHAYSLNKNLFICRDTANTPIVTRAEETQTLCKISADNMNIVVETLVDDVALINGSSVKSVCFANTGDVLTINDYQTNYVFIKVVQDEA